MGDTVKSIRMVRDPETCGEPSDADVHPDEVENYKAGGFVVADSDEGKRLQAALRRAKSKE